MKLNNIEAEKVRRLPGFSYSTEDILQAKERQRGKILADNEVISVAANGDLDNLDTIALWFGSGIPLARRPFLRFADILRSNFDDLEKGQKEKLLLNGIRIVVGDYLESGFYGPQRSMWSNFVERLSFLDVPFGPADHYETRQKNLGELLNSMLKFTNNDLQLARNFLAKMSSPSRQTRETTGIVCCSFYYPAYDVSSESIREDYLKINPKIRLLAFWMDAYIGWLWQFPARNISSTENMLEVAYPKFDPELKTQMAILIKERLLNRRVFKTTYAMIGRLADKELTEVEKTGGSNSPLASEFGDIKRILETDRLIEQTKGGRINAEELIDLLEKIPSLLEYVAEKELQTVLDKTQDHLLAARIIKLIKDKSQSPMS